MNIGNMKFHYVLHYVFHYMFIVFFFLTFFDLIEKLTIVFQYLVQ
jgi:hypothetical protein